MAFPVNIRAEIAFNAAGDPADWIWTDVTSDLLGGTPIQITRGRGDEQGQLEPSECTFTLRNQRGDYTPGNPLSPHYPGVDLGAPVRVSLPEWIVDGTHLHLPGLFGQHPVTRRQDFTLDSLDVRVDADAGSWRTEGDILALASGSRGEAATWFLVVDQGGFVGFPGHMIFLVTPQDAETLVLVSDSPIPEDSGRTTVRAVVDPLNDHIGFYVGGSIDGPWETLGVWEETLPSEPFEVADTPFQVVVGASSIVDARGSSEEMLRGDLHRFRLGDPLNDRTVADVEFTDIPGAVGSLTDSVGVTWEFPPSIVEGHEGYRFYGHVSDLLPTWPHGDLSDEDDPGESTVEITASGISRRLGQGATPLRSPMFRRMQAEFVRRNTVAYWPGEDGENSTRMASGYDHEPMEVIRSIVFESDVEFSSFDGFPGSAPVPEFHTSPMRGTVPHYDLVPDWTGDAILRDVDVSFVLHIPDGGIGGDDRVRLLTIITDGSAAEVVLWAHPGGEVSQSIFDRSANEIDHSGESIGSLSGTVSFGSFGLRGATQYEGASTFLTFLDPIPTGRAVADGYDVGRVTSVVIGDPNGDLNGTAIGHVAVHYGQSFSPTLDLVGGYEGHAGELAALRMNRLCTEQGIPLRIIGDWDLTLPMGPQPTKSIVELLQECADADGGILSETRQEPGFTYRTRESLYNQDSEITLDAASPEGGDIVNPFEPVLDDQNVRNDITVQRDGGSSSRILDQDDIGRRGLYDESVTLNVADDIQLPHIAGWRLHLGTWPGMRYPTVSPAIDVNPDLLGDWITRDLGDRVDVINLPPQHPGDVSSIMQGYVEAWLPNRVDIEVNTTPAGPWDVAVIGESHADTGGSELASDLDEDSELVSVRVSEGETVQSAWTDDREDLPYLVDIGGEHVRFEGSNAIRDDFNREVAQGWGMPSSSWSRWRTVGDPDAFAVAAGSGRISLNDPGPTLWALHDTDILNTEIRASVSVDQAAEGGPHIIGLTARYTHEVTNYLARLIIYDSEVFLDIIKLVAGAETNIGGAATSLEPEAEVHFDLRFQVDGDSLKFRAWQNEEPESWDIEVTDTDLSEPGDIGVSVRSASASEDDPVTVSFHSVESSFLDGVQQFHVTRSINGIRKSHSAGTPVSLAYPAIIAL